MTAETQPRALSTIDGEYRVVRPLVSADEALARWNEYQALVVKIVGPSDIQSFSEDGKKKSFIKRSGWQKLATYYGLGISMVSERLFHKHDPKTCLRAVMPDKYGEVIDCNCPVVGARYVVRATAPNGRSVEQIGLATFNEKNAKYARVEHDLATKAYTRAFNRAISSMVGAGEVSAEEVRATEEVRGLSLEDKDAIRNAWAAAPTERRDAATAYMRSNGFAGADIRALFTDFNARAADDQVRELRGVLAGDETFFDPDLVEGSPS